jgi:zona occludens toxin (predicted ATPase)
MLYLYTGTPGSGKSYHATYLCHHATKRGVNILANFFVKLSPKQEHYFFFCPLEKMTVEYFINFHREHHVEGKESQTIIIIDEASVLFNAREYGRKDRSDWLKFFSQHRKLGYDIILISQIDRMLDRQIRGNVEIQKLHRKLTNWGFKGWIIALLTGKKFVCINKWYQIDSKKDSRIDTEYFSIKKKIADSYDTFSMFSDH